MSNPRLCEILGVEANTPFHYNDGVSGDLFKIDKAGVLLACHSSEMNWQIAETIDLCEMINSGIPRWTEEDVEAAKAIRWLIPSADKIGWAGEVKAVLGEFINRPLLVLPPELFPNLRPGETVRLKEILEGDEENAD